MNFKGVTASMGTKELKANQFENAGQRRDNRHRFSARMVIAGAALFFVATLSGAEKANEREVTFQNNDVKLAGTLLLPATPGVHPGIVMVHGSGPETRMDVRQLGEGAVRFGYAALIYDKRGTGASTGSWIESSLDDLADDVIAGAAFLKTQPEIDAHHVGAWGVSQAGWVIPRAVARQPDAFAFAIVVTGGGLRPADVERYDYAAALDRMQVTPEQKKEGMALVDRYLTYLKNGQDRAGLLQAIKGTRGQTWYTALNIGRVVPDEASRAKWSWVPELEPKEDIAKMRLPVLVMLGGRDRPTLTAEMSQRWRSSLASNMDATIVEMVNAGHGMVVGAHHMNGEAHSYAPGYLEMVDGWLRAHTATTPPSPPK
jgi:pimeloyl-ACP methyl ester carboxylesterase